jgi:hypothetical protein
MVHVPVAQFDGKPFEQIHSVALQGSAGSCDEVVSNCKKGLAATLPQVLST